MYIIKLGTVSSSEENYDVVIAANEDISYTCRVRDALNDFCCRLAGLNNIWITMDEELNSVSTEKEFNDCLLPIMDYDKAHNLFEKIKAACEKHTVYIYSNSFSMEEVASI